MKSLDEAINSIDILKYQNKLLESNNSKVNSPLRNSLRLDQHIRVGESSTFNKMNHTVLEIKGDGIKTDIPGSKNQLQCQTVPLFESMCFDESKYTSVNQGSPKTKDLFLKSQTPVRSTHKKIHTATFQMTVVDDDEDFGICRKFKPKCILI